MARIGRIIAWTVAVLIAVPLLLVAVVLVGGNTGPGRHLIERLTPGITGGAIRLSGLAGRFPDRLRAERLELTDPRGAYLTIDGLTFDWAPLHLLQGVLAIQHLDASRVDFARMPVASGKQSSSSGLPVQVTIGEMTVDRLEIGAALAGQTIMLTVSGSGGLDSATTAHGTLTVRRLDGAGQYSLAGAIDAQRLKASIKVDEPAHGLISSFAGLPELGPIAVDASLDGPPDAVAASLSASAGPLRAHVQGSLDLVKNAADLTVAANAPAMSPRPDVSWQDVSVDAHMHGPFTKPELSGQARIDALKAMGAGITRLTADLAGNAGTARLHASVDGLTLPGQDPNLLAGAPLVLDATARLDAPDRPVEFSLRHPLVQAQGTAKTAGAQAVHVVLTLPDLAPVAAAGGATVQGKTALTLDVARQGATTTLALNGTLGVTGGQPQAQALLGDSAKLDLAASLTGQDAHLTRLHVTGRGVDVAAHGGLVNAHADLDWAVAITDLSALQPTLTGRIDASGHVDGSEEDLAASAELHGTVSTKGIASGPITVRIDAQHLPSQPTGTATIQGALLGSPVDVALEARRTGGVTQATVQRAAWKSLQAGGEMTLPAGASLPQGTLHLRMARLADLSPLLGRPLAGSIEAALEANAGSAHLTLTAQGAGMPGTASASRASLDATITHPESNPTVQATLTVDGIAAGSVGGSTRLEVHGPQNALAVSLSVTSPDLSGSPARVTAAATIDVPAQTASLSSLQADWNQQSLRLLAPARFDFGNGGAAIDHLRLGLRQAVLEVNGRVSPTLDLTASLRDLPADIAAVVAPSMAADGTIGAEARLTGTTARPQGTVRVTATGLRQRSGPGQAVPAANLTANATLNGTTARIDVRATAGTALLTLAGTAPLAPTGALDLHAGGRLDLAMLNPMIAADGRRVRGQLALDAAIAGTVAAPRVNGTARLTGGDAQDYVVGAHLTDINATIEADGDHVRIAQFSAHAGDGTLGGSGTIGLAAPMPVDLTFTADNARPIASDLMTATVDWHLTVQGNVQGTITAAGTLHTRRVEIRVPDKMPTSVAVIPVRNAPVAGPRPGSRRREAVRVARASRTNPSPQPWSASRPKPSGGGGVSPMGPPAANAPPPAAPTTAPTTNVMLNVTLDAPQQVFVRGRGLDVELGGVVHIHGTAANPQPDGGLELRRGTLSVVGTTLTFTEGDIDFTGAPLTDPNIRLVATSSNNNITATVTVSGSASDPKITLSSVPDLPQDEILSQLLFQQSTGNLSAFQVAEIAAGLAELSGAGPGGGDPLGSLRNALGLDRLSVGSSSSGSPTLQAGRYIAPGVYLGAQQSATGNGTQASVEVDLAKGLKLVTTAGTGTTSATGASGGGDAASIGLKYQFQY